MTSKEKQDVLPANLPPRGLSRLEAARYVGVSPTLFDQMIRDRRIPKPFRVNGRVLWDRKKVDAAIDALSELDSPDDVWANPIA
ncbi:MAG: hypothetical protein JSR89_04975 [Proteobacteria bacterium]|nr:hypothetical protein [Pseudomonadota bacterium]